MTGPPYETRRSRSVQPNDAPTSRCTECGHEYNPYKHGVGNCPSCSEDAEEDAL